MSLTSSIVSCTLHIRLEFYGHEKRNSFGKSFSIQSTSFERLMIGQSLPLFNEHLLYMIMKENRLAIGSFLERIVCHKVL